MPRNVEIKARVPDLAAVRTRAVSLVSIPAELVSQVDTFFAVPRGRLKLREFADGAGELIVYERADRNGPKESDYVRVGCADPQALREALARALPVRGQVRKRREVFFAGRTRIHLDQVEGLGSFVELEVVLRAGESVEDGEREARDLMQKLAIPDGALVAAAYIDLLAKTPA